MQDEAFLKVVEVIRARDPRYAIDAYFFVRAALDFTSKRLNKPTDPNDPRRHVTGRELLEGLRAFALQEFGPMAFTVLNAWGIHRTEDVGEIVFNLVENGVLGKTDQDRREDFANGYDFREAFEKPFLPKKSRESIGRRAPRGLRERRARS